MIVLLPLLPALLLPSVPCVPAQEPALAARPPGAAVPLVRAHGLLYVEVEGPDGAPLLALLDTGASASAVAPGPAAGLPERGATEVLGTDGLVAATRVELAGLRLGGLPLPDLLATRRELAGLPAPGDRPVDLILGSDALLGLAVTLDLRAGRLELAPGSADGEGPADGVAMELDDGIPTIPASIGGLDLVLRIDTGASLFPSPDVYVNVPASVRRRLEADGQVLEPAGELSGSGARGETIALPVLAVGGALVGPLPLERVLLIVQPELGYFARSDARGFVGVNFLEKLGRVTLDYHGRRLSVATSAR